MRSALLTQCEQIASGWVGKMRRSEINNSSFIQSQETYGLWWELDPIIMYVKEVFWCYYVFSLGPLQAVDLFDEYFKSGHISSVCCKVYAMSDCIKYPNCLSIEPFSSSLVYLIKMSKYNELKPQSTTVSIKFAVDWESSEDQRSC